MTLHSSTLEAPGLVTGLAALPLPEGLPPAFMSDSPALPCFPGYGVAERLNVGRAIGGAQPQTVWGFDVLPPLRHVPEVSGQLLGNVVSEHLREIQRRVPRFSGRE